MILRLPIQVRLYKNVELVRKINTSKKSQVRSKVSETAFDYGTCRVWYNKHSDYWNEFSFGSAHQLLEFLTVNTELPLVHFLKGIIPKNYLEKRKLSLSQRLSCSQSSCRVIVSGVAPRS